MPRLSQGRSTRILKQEGVHLAQLVRDLGAEFVDLWLDDGVADVDACAFVEVEQSSLGVGDFCVGVLDHMQAVVTDHDLLPAVDLGVALH